MLQVERDKAHEAEQRAKEAASKALQREVVMEAVQSALLVSQKPDITPATTRRAIGTPRLDYDRWSTAASRGHAKINPETFDEAIARQRNCATCAEPSGRAEVQLSAAQRKILATVGSGSPTRTLSLRLGQFTGAPAQPQPPSPSVSLSESMYLD